MADGTKIEWTNATWNPITGCMVKSPGCINCYAMREAGAGRVKNHPSRVGLTHEVNGRHVWTGEVRFNEAWLDQPLRWKRPRDIFVVAHGDLAYEKVPDAWIDCVFDVIFEAKQHRYQILTKRPDRLRAYILSRYWLSLGNIWIGTSVERQQEADERRPHLEALARMGWNTWVSYEPALGPVDWRGWQFIRWMVSGGESGTDARPSHPDWHRATRDWCAAHEIPYFFKQWGEWSPEGTIQTRGRPGWHNLDSGMFRIGKKAAGALLDGVAHKAMPDG